jgi:ABC-type Fe3+ transport system permease subunit
MSEVSMKKNATHILYHIAVVVLSAAIALSLPNMFRYLSRKILVSWSFIENQKLFLVSLEIAAAILLIIVINAVVNGWSVRKARGRQRSPAWPKSLPRCRSLPYGG